ncbi:MFS transporter [Paraburkholderia dinghuensis]|uniref:MFS transporter n=1 Tax=Paraburkholderia dinghuensis TaxID=2305225 RepID=A0A3N6MSH5_9BURK|nr:MFS transporter [Paraburkholderia dinghuensis]RQH06914.1 MFS transporter [Paraburkholderia dinghuensis]
MSTSSAGVFRSLRSFNYRVWATGAIVSNIGTWMQRTAQDWLVLTGLTHHSAAAVGIVMGLQFGPQLLFLPWSGYAADHFNQRKLLMTTQATLGALALVLGVLTVTGVVQLWHVYVFAFLFGCTAAFDAPVRQTFVSELVADGDLSNAVALNSTSFNAARMIGPAVAGVVIASVGVGWAFLLNGLSFVAVLISLTRLRAQELRVRERAHPARGNMTAGLRYVWSRPDLKAIVIMLALIGTFGLNFPIFISTMAVRVFHTDASGYGLLSSLMAVGTVTGALFGARRSMPRFSSLLTGSIVFGAGCALAAVAPGYAWFGAALVLIGIAALTLTTTTNSLMQLSTEPAMRGRVLAIRLGVALGGTPIGAPIVGWIADHCGPRWALAVGAASGFAAAFVAIRAMRRDAHLHTGELPGTEGKRDAL